MFDKDNKFGFINNNENSNNNIEGLDKVKADINNVKNDLGNEELTTINKDVKGAINELNTQYKDIANEKFKTTNDIYQNIKHIKSIYYDDECIITFVDDDGRSGFLTNTKPAYEKYNIKPTVAVIPEKVGQNDYMTLAQLKTLQNEGYDIVGHSYSHSEAIFKNTSDSISSETIETDFKKCYEWLKNNNFNFETVVYPWGYFEQTGQKKRYCNLAKKYFNYGINAGYVNNIQWNGCPNDNMYLNRYFINLSTSMTIENIKGVINGAINNKSWLILGLHSGETSQINTTQLDEIIAYIKTTSAKILPFSQAVKVKGNVLSAGEYTDTTGFFIGANGSLKGNLNNIDLKEYEVKIVPSVPLTGYSLATNLENNIGRLGKHINGTVSLVNADMTGNISQNDILVTFEQNAAPSLPKWIKAFCITSTGIFEEFYCTIEWSKTSTVIKAQQNVKNNNIRWIICEFTYISKL